VKKYFLEREETGALICVAISALLMMTYKDAILQTLPLFDEKRCLGRFIPKEYIFAGERQLTGFISLKGNVNFY